MQNGFHSTDTFNPVEELRRARAANGGQKIIDSHAKQEAVLGAALTAHGDDSAKIDEDTVDVSAALRLLQDIFQLEPQSCMTQPACSHMPLQCTDP